MRGITPNMPAGDSARVSPAKTLNRCVPMDAELTALEQKLSQFMEFCQRLRVENTALRQQLAAAVNENKHLTDKIGAARSRLETLLEKMPEDEA